MAIISDAGLTWSAPITLASDEVWQTRQGRVFITTTASPGSDDGIELLENQGLRLSGGRVVRYRKTGAGTAQIAREEV